MANNIINSIKFLLMIFLVFFTGSIIGWLTGMSLSPVISGVISAILGASIALIIVKKEQGSPSLTSFFLFFSLCLGIVIFSTLGFLTRTGAKIEIFDYKIPSVIRLTGVPQSSGLATSNNPQYLPGLLGASTSQCEELMSTPTSIIREVLNNTGDKEWMTLSREAHSNQELKLIVRDRCLSKQ